MAFDAWRYKDLPIEDVRLNVQTLDVLLQEIQDRVGTSK